MFTEGLTFIHSKVSQSLSLREVAQHCNISESYCSNLFARYLNMNFKDYFTSLKVIDSIKGYFHLRTRLTLFQNNLDLVVIPILQINLKLFRL